MISLIFKNKYRLSSTYFFLPIIIIFFSCSQNKGLSESKKIQNKLISEQQRKDKKANNSFLAYYNSYYLAKVKFQDAFELMNKEDDRNRRSVQSFELFDDAIKYATIVINDFHNTDYFEDAAYIIARSSYYKNLLSPSTYYFKIVLKNKTSPYYFDSLVRLGFINLTLNNQNELSLIMNELESNLDEFNKNINFLKKKIPYKFLENELLNTKSNYFILKAEMLKNIDSSNESIENFYLKAIEVATTNNHKKEIYSKLILFFEKLNDESKVLKYINKFKDEFDIDESLDELMTNWYTYNRKLGFFDDIHNYIDNQLSNDLNNEDRIYYSIEKARTYIEQNRFIQAEDIYNDLLLEYEKTMNSYKNYFSDIYFDLSQIYIEQYIDYNKALEYLSLSLEKKPTDQDIKNKFQSLENYISLLDQYLILTSSKDNAVPILEDNDISNDNAFMIPIPSDYKYEIANTDTILFNMSSILYFELGLKDRALENLNIILNNNINSSLMPQVISFLSEISPSNDLGSIYIPGIDSSYVDQDDFLLLEIKDKQKDAFLEMEKSIDNALELFKNNYEKYNDLLSLYMIGLIYDEYIGDIENTVKYYSSYIEYDNGDYYNEVSGRLDDIKLMLKNQIKFLEKNILYNDGLSYINNSSDLYNTDSMVVVLEEYKSNLQSVKNRQYNELLDVLDFPSHLELNDTLSKNNNYHISNKSRGREPMDNLIFNIAEFIHRKTQNSKLALEYYEIIINYYSDSELYGDAVFAINEINPDSDLLPSFLEKKYEDFLKIERFVPRTGQEVINATESYLYPENFQSENIIYSIISDSLEYDFFDVSQLNPIARYDLKMKEKFLSYDSNSKGQMAILDDGVVKYFLSNDKLFSNNNSMIAVDPNYKNDIEIPIFSYFFNQDFLLVAYEIFDSINKTGYRYNINNSQSECMYLETEYFCYEIDYIPSSDGRSKTVWVLEIEDNVFIKIKEHEFDNDGNLLFITDIAYTKIEPYYIISNIQKNDLTQNIITILKRDEIQLNNSKFFVEKPPSMKVQSSAFKNNFFYTSSSYEDINEMNIELNRLVDLYDLLFPELDEFVEEGNFEYTQSINQYFYFVEDASIGGVELSNDDWLVSYNNDIVVGARKYTVGGKIDVPIMGYDNSSENTKITTEGYCENGDLPIIKVHKSDGQIIDMDIIQVDGDLQFKSLGHATVILKKD